MSLIMSRTPRRPLLLVPLAVAGLGGAAALALLSRMRRGTYDPHSLPSVLVGKKLPNFNLPASASPIRPRAMGIASDEIISSRRPALLNFFASWCAPCTEEAAVLMALKSRGAAIYGIAYKDDPAATARFLATSGDPYVCVGNDAVGNVAIDFGLYGVPETYVTDSHGVVRLRWVGALTVDVASDTIVPLLKALA